MAVWRPPAWVLVAGLAGTLAAVMLAVTSAIPPSARTAASVSLGPESLLQEIAVARDMPTAPDALVPDADLAAASRSVMLRLRLRRPPTVEIRRRPLTRELLVTARERDARSSARLANAFVGALMTERQESLRQTYLELRARDAVLARLAPSPAAGRVQARIERVERLYQLEGAGLTLTQPASEAEAVRSPRTGRDVGVAAVLGAMIGLSGVAWRRRRRRQAPGAPAESFSAAASRA